jgi:ribosomal protein S27AE
MVSHCPGQDGRNLKVGLYKCPECGAEVEIFSDETRIKCRKCGTYVYRDKCRPALNGALPPASVWVKKDGMNYRRE